MGPTPTAGLPETFSSWAPRGRAVAKKARKLRRRCREEQSSFQGYRLRVFSSLLPRINRFWHEKGWAEDAWVNRLAASRSPSSADLSKATQRATKSIASVLATAVALHSWDRYNAPRPPNARQR